VAQLEVLEAFRNREGLTGGLLRRPFADGLLQFGPVPDLAFVLTQSLDLEVDRLADVNPDIGLRVSEPGMIASSVASPAARWSGWLM
jgi:hypothetical protein